MRKLKATVIPVLAGGEVLHRIPKSGAACIARFAAALQAPRHAVNALIEAIRELEVLRWNASDALIERV